MTGRNGYAVCCWPFLEYTIVTGLPAVVLITFAELRRGADGLAIDADHDVARLRCPP